MLRVHPGRLNDMDPSRDFDANTAQEQPGGGLFLGRVSVREVRDPRNLTAPPMVQVSTPMLVRLIAAGYWSEVENLDTEDEAGEADPNSEEGRALVLAGGHP